MSSTIMSSDPAVRTGTRRLSAIMFTDMEGYTALMQQNEEKARHDRDRQRAVLERHIQKHAGRILQFYGDGALSVFDSAIEAVTAGIAIERELNGSDPVPLRLGIHTGDVVYDADGVFGDGVNVASRIQSLGTAGSVLVSAKVYDEIKNQPQIAAVSLGEFQLKNVRRPIEVFAIISDGVRMPSPEALPGPARQEKRSVAVLPFVNLSADPENEFFSDGITEEIINALTRVNGLQVTARTSSFAFKGRNDDIRSIARQLGVETVLEGSVRKAGPRVRITAQYIDAASGYHIFSHTWDRTLEDVFGAQDEIAGAIVSAVGDRMEPRRQHASGTQRTSVQAHALFLRGLHEYYRWTPESARRAIEFFTQALALDETYTPALAWQAYCLMHLGASGQANPPATMAAAEAVALQALRLDPLQPDAHIALAYVKLLGRWDFEGGYAALQKGLGLAPGSAVAHHAFGLYLNIVGEFEQAVEEMETATQLDPLSLPTRIVMGWALLNARRYQDALVVMDSILDADPLFRAAADGRGLVLCQLGRYDEALRMFERVVEITGDPYKGLATRGLAYARMGRRDDARRIIEQLEERQAQHPELALAIDFAIVHCSLGDIDQALVHFEHAAQLHLSEVPMAVNGVLWEPMRADPRFLALLERHGLSRIARPVRAQP